MVVGSFKRVANRDNIYAALPKGALAPEKSSLNDLSDVHKPLETGRYYAQTLGDPFGWHSYQTTGIFREHLTRQQDLDVALDNWYVSALTFDIPDAAKLAEIKEQLETLKFSGPSQANDVRITVVIEDAQFLENISSIDQRSRYLEILYPVLLVLVLALGAITGFLAVRSRRENIALMRGMGTKKTDIFVTILGEQALLLLIGAGLAAVLLLMQGQGDKLLDWQVYAFLFAYAISVIVATIQQNSKSALSIRQEKD